MDGGPSTAEVLFSSDRYFTVRQVTMVTAPKFVDFLDATCTDSNRGVFKSNKLQPRESLDPGECNIAI